MLTKIEGARYPYGNISLLLVSHNHLDHFHAESVARHLMNNSGAQLVSSTQVIDEVLAANEKLKEKYGKSNTRDAQLKKIEHVWKKTDTFEKDGVKVRFLSLLHANSKVEKYRKIQNLGHLIEIGGKKLLHIGDADMFEKNFSEFKLNEENIDVAFIPYWFILSKEGRSLIKNHINAKTIVAVHVPPKDQSKTIRDLLGAMPSAVVFSQTGEMLNY
jgi:L-ascorbate metabolism protein UlaG (beta-lactamase superfamily)